MRIGARQTPEILGEVDAAIHLVQEFTDQVGMWLVSSDVTGERDAERVGRGPTGSSAPPGT